MFPKVSLYQTKVCDPKRCNSNTQCTSFLSRSLAMQDFVLTTVEMMAGHLPLLLQSSHPLMTRRFRRQAEPGKTLPSHLILYSYSPSLLISFPTSPPPPLPPPTLSPPPPPPPLTQEVHKGSKRPCPAPLAIPTLLAPLTCSAHRSYSRRHPAF